MVISCLNNLFYSIISSKSNVGFRQSRKDEIRMAWCQRPPGPNQDTESPKSEWRISEEKKTRLYRMFTRREQLGGGFLESIFLKQSFWVSRHGFWPQRPSRRHAEKSARSSLEQQWKVLLWLRWVPTGRLLARLPLPTVTQTSASRIIPSSHLRTR